MCSVVNSIFVSITRLIFLSFMRVREKDSVHTVCVCLFESVRKSIRHIQPVLSELCLEFLLFFVISFTPAPFTRFPWWHAPTFWWWTKRTYTIIVWQAQIHSILLISCIFFFFFAFSIICSHKALVSWVKVFFSIIGRESNVAATEQQQQ